jgi:osmoprotectant transport system permease protein
MTGDLAAELARLPGHLSSHLLLTLGALLAGLAISLPLGALVVLVRPLAAPVLAVASVIQTIPGLALLALMVPLLGRIGVVPALVALTLYSVLPVLRNTVTGALEVDANVLEAARGIGMTDGQILRRVQLPLAAPVIVAGLRTATVWTVGMATLSTPVGAPSLGNYIFSGLQTQNMTAVLVGCGAAAGLAVVLDGIIRLAELGARRRDPRLAAVSLAGLALLVAFGTGAALRDALRGEARPHVEIGAKTFTEQYILARLLAERLEVAGFEVGVRDSLGSTVAFDALVASQIDLYVDYTGTLWANQLRRRDTPGAERIRAELTAWLDAEYGVAVLGRLGFENAYALAMRRADAKALGIRGIGDLALHSSALAIGGDYEFFARPEWEAVRAAYGLAFRERRTFDPTLMYGAIAEGLVDVISAFSTDGRINALDLVVLDDPRRALPPYEAVLLLSPEARRHPAIADALRPLLGRIDAERMRRANQLVDVDGQSIESAALQLGAGLP